MHNIDDVTLMHDSQTGSVVLIIPKPIVFENADEFSYFIDLLNYQLSLYIGTGDEISSIDPDYAVGVIADWTKQLKQYLPQTEGSETLGHKTPGTEL